MRADGAPEVAFPHGGDQRGHPALPAAAGSSRCSSGTWADRSGAARTTAAWSIPKGNFTDEEPLAAALREFAEEIGRPAPEVEYVELGAFRYSSGKLVTVFAGESDFDPDEVVSNLFEIEWPPRSGRLQSFPELDAAGWFAPDEARDRLVKGQRPALDALVQSASPATDRRSPGSIGTSAVGGTSALGTSALRHFRHRNPASSGTGLAHGTALASSRCSRRRGRIGGGWAHALPSP